MKFGLPISFAVHFALGFGGLYLWRGDVKPLPKINVISLNMITVSDVTNIKRTIKKPDPEPVKEAQPAPPPEPEPIAEPTETVPDIPQPANDEIEKTDEPSKPAPPKFDLDALADQFKNIREENPNANEQKTLTSEVGLPEYADIDRKGAGDRTALTASAKDYIRAKTRPCWNIDIGAQDYKNLRVEVRLRLDRHGEVLGVDVLNDAQIIASPNKSWRAARDKVVIALRECAPYNGLPGHAYEEWKSMKLNFQPGA
ncbi:MAG TPA: hypothetical protein ENJ42_04485 [Hellea balneolensis]|uniref:Energy transducer TonB n=1 Tax=Hellea balneolensis TaxID=287478 RepID=A0A7C5LT65_9PROT|nr:hypothetical protein [Hellea balneolensis]